MCGVVAMARVRAPARRTEIRPRRCFPRKVHDCCAQTVLDGSRVNVVLPPLAVDGPALTIRRFRRHGFAPEDLVANGTLTRPLLDFLARAVHARATILVCGGTGSGKTTTLNALSGFAGAQERIVTIEDAAGL